MSLALLAAAALTAGPITLGHAAVFLIIERGAHINPEVAVPLYVSMLYHGLTAIGAAVLFLWLRRRRAVGSTWPRALLLAGTLLAVLSADLLVGLAFPPLSHNVSVLIPHPTRGWYHRANTVGSEAGVVFRINALGLRGPEVPPQKDPAERRVLTLGDSVALGFALREPESYAGQIQRRLDDARPGRRVRVINGAVGGYTTWQEFELLRDIGEAVRPDVVVLNFCVNDMIDAIRPRDGKFIGNPLRYEDTRPYHWSGFVRAAHTLYFQREDRAARNAQAWAKYDAFGDPATGLTSQDDLYREPTPACVVTAWRRIEADLDDVRAYCDERGWRFVLVFFPPERQFFARNQGTDPPRYLREWAARTSTPFLDLGAVFREELERSGRDISALLLDEVHPTPDGSRVAGEALADFLIGQRLLSGDVQSNPG